MNQDEQKQEMTSNASNKAIHVNAMVMRSVEDDPPPNGTLCLLYFPIGMNNVTGESSGPVAAAYKVDGGWKMADTPSPLRGFFGEVGPAYWQEILLA